MVIWVLSGDYAIRMTTANDKTANDFLFTFSSNHGSVSLGFRDTGDVKGNFFGVKGTLATMTGGLDFHHREF